MTDHIVKEARFMREWKEVVVQTDIDELLEICGGFHDTCVVSVNYRSGASVDENNAMHFGTLADHELTVVLHGQWEPKEIELCFSGVRKFHLNGWRNNYTCEILEAHLSLYEGLWEGMQERLIVWSDSYNFDINQLSVTTNESTDTYVIAGALKWRSVDAYSANITLKQIIQRKAAYYENDNSEEFVVVNKGYVRGFNQMLADINMGEAEFIVKYADIVKGLKNVFETPEEKTEEDIEELSGYNNAIVEVLGLLDEKYIYDENM